jgi:hypothetical protein
MRGFVLLLAGICHKSASLRAKQVRDPVFDFSAGISDK